MRAVAAGFRAKRLLDLVVGTLLLVVTLPLWILIFILIKLDSPGPAFFTEQRLGLEGTPFKVYKFRTMVANAPPIRAEDGSWDNPPVDPRVTRTGRVLRKTSLDELAQLINVVKGQMSLVGPRPDPVEALDLYEPGDFARLSVPPGMTGWAAIHGRKAIPLRQRRALDLDYVANRTMTLDMKILLMTVPAVLRSEGVHSRLEPGDGSQ